MIWLISGWIGSIVGVIVSTDAMWWTDVWYPGIHGTVGCGMPAIPWDLGVSWMTPISRDPVAVPAVL